MSNLNKHYIYCPSSIDLEFQMLNNSNIIWVSGIFGTWYVRLPKNQHCIVLKNKILLYCNKYYNLHKYYNLNHEKSYKYLNNNLSSANVYLKKIIWGAGVGFKKYLRVRGVGYKFEIVKGKLSAQVGLTHKISKKLSEEFFTKFSRKSKVVKFRSKNLLLLTNNLSQIRAQKKPDVYKGKGIRYKKEFINRKEGKKKKSF